MRGALCFEDAVTGLKGCCLFLRYFSEGFYAQKRKVYNDKQQNATIKQKGIHNCLVLMYLIK